VQEFRNLDALLSGELEASLLLMVGHGGDSVIQSESARVRQGQTDSPSSPHEMPI
jgi:hypothetical protein